MRLVIDIADDKVSFLKELLQSLPFVKKVTDITPNEITNPAVLASIEQYEQKKKLLYKAEEDSIVVVSMHGHYQ